MTVKKLKDYLDNNQIKYVTLSHSSAYTALEVAASAHIPGKELAKTVIVRIDNKMAMVVLPAAHKIDFALLKTATNAIQVELAAEDEFTGLFANCEVGAMPPFGNLYDMDTYITEILTQHADITFAAGSHSELLTLAYKDFEKLVQPIVINFSEPR